MDEILRQLERFDQLDLAAGVGALQLLPENADRLLRLVYFASLLPSVRTRNGWRPASSAAEWDGLLNGDNSVVKNVVHLEDPFNYPFTDGVTFLDGVHTVFSGLAEAGPFVTRLVFQALFQTDPGPGSDHFRRWARQLCLAVLTIGDEIACRAGLQRGVRAGTSPDGKCFVPDSIRFSELKDAVTFTPGEMEAVLRRRHCSISDLDAILFGSSAETRTPRAENDHPVCTRPILRLPDHYVVVAPGALLTVARHAILSRAVEEGIGNEIATLIRERTFNNVRNSLERMGMRFIGMLPEDQAAGFCDAVFSFDTDKVAHVTVATDSLSNWQSNVVPGEWNCEALNVAIPTAQFSARRRLLEINPASRVLHLVTLQGVGRTFALSYDRGKEHSRCLTLTLSAENLEVLSLLVEANQLTLWQFAQARQTVRQNTQIMVWDTLDEYGFYRMHRCSYYASDDAPPTMICIQPDHAEEIRCEARNRFDCIAAYHPDLRGVLDLVNVAGDPSIPIYAPYPDADAPFSPMVANLPLPIWVLTPALLPEPRYRSLYFDVADMIAYWIWQFSPALVSFLTPVAERCDWLVIDVELVPGEAWFINESSTSQVNGVEASPSDRNHIRLTIHPTQASAFGTADNSGERDVVRTLLVGLRQWARRYAISPLSDVTDDEIAALLDTYAPLGRKKKLFMLNGDLHPELSYRGLPRYRRVQAFDIQVVLDHVGLFVRRRVGCEPRSIAQLEFKELCNAIVEHLYEGIRSLVAELSPDGLLEFLLAHNERLTYEREFRQLTIPTRTACFGTSSLSVRQLQDELAEINTANLANRFLVEYVAARPARGTLTFSLSVYDRLMALASQVITFGMTSDAIEYGLSNRSSKVLPSGRLALEDSAFEIALEEFRGLHTLGEVDRSHQNFNRFWRARGDRNCEETNRLIEQMDAAAAEEFGFSVDELNQFLDQIVHVGCRMDGEPKRLLVSTLIDRLVGELHWTPERVRCAFELFALRSRPNFLSPPDGFTRPDVYPWRFNRGLSYLRRPVLVWNEYDNEEAIWGVRMVRMSARYFTSLCTGGRLKNALTLAMQQAMGAFHERDGKRFNHQVAELFRAVPRFVVRENVWKVGRQKLRRPNGQDLGDIDVLVADSEARELFPVETKDLAVAMTPPELRLELDELFGTSDGNPGHIDTFFERVEWLKSHLAQVLTFLGLVSETASQWKIKPMLVLDREMISPLLARRPGLEVLSIRQLRERLGTPVAAMAKQ